MKKNHGISMNLCRIAAMLLLFSGAFLMGVGSWRIWSDLQDPQEYQHSWEDWSQETAGGTGEKDVRDSSNQMLADAMAYVTIERQIQVRDDVGYVGISVNEKSRLGCSLLLLRDATGEVLYESALIEPGYYIEEIQMAGRLKSGFYPCTAVWQFYTEEGEYAGETALKTVVVVDE